MIRIGSKLTFAALLLGLGCSSSSNHSSTQTGPNGTKQAPLVTPDVYLRAQAFQVPAGQFGNAAPITMWGYAQCTAGFASCGTPTVPGPALTAFEGTTLTVHVRNGLTGPYVEPTSIVVPGQLTQMTPVWIDSS